LGEEGGRKKWTRGGMYIRVGKSGRVEGGYEGREQEPTMKNWGEKKSPQPIKRKQVLPTLKEGSSLCRDRKRGTK